jgi:hypothetical protein
LTSPAFAQEQICGERDIIVSQLETKHGEFRRSVGLQDNSIVVEVFASDHGTWTILFTKPTGISCFMAVGKAWENDEPRDDVGVGTSL